MDPFLRVGTKDEIQRTSSLDAGGRYKGAKELNAGHERSVARRNANTGSFPLV
jgi:hypothetical protein